MSGFSFRKLFGSVGVRIALVAAIPLLVAIVVLPNHFRANIENISHQIEYDALSVDALAFYHLVNAVAENTETLCLPAEAFDLADTGASQHAGRAVFEAPGCAPLGARLLRRPEAACALSPCETVVDFGEGPQMAVAMVVALGAASCGQTPGSELEGVDGCLTVWRPLAAHKQRLAAVSWWPQLAILLATLMTLAGAGLMSVLTGRRVRTITQSIEAFAKGDRASLIEVRGSDDEFDDLARAVNSSLQRIRADMSAMVRLGGSISHQLIAPIRAIRSVVGSQSAALTELADRSETGARVRAAAQSLEQAESQLSHLVEAGEAMQNLLSASKLRPGRTADMVDLMETSHVLASRFAAKARQRGIAIEIEGADAEVRTSQIAVEQMLSVLIDNAIIYGPAQGVIRIMIESTPAETALSVEDGGWGPAFSVINEVFGSFAVAQSVVSARDGIGGHGLGLLTVRQLAANCSIDLRQASIEPAGWRVTMAWSAPVPARGLGQ